MCASPRSSCNNCVQDYKGLFPGHVRALCLHKLMVQLEKDPMFDGQAINSLNPQQNEGFARSGEVLVFCNLEPAKMILWTGIHTNKSTLLPSQHEDVDQRQSYLQALCLVVCTRHVRAPVSERRQLHGIETQAAP